MYIAEISTVESNFYSPSPLNLFRPALQRLISPWLLVTCIFALHAVIRFGGLSNPLFIPLSMVIIWPLPWLLASRQGWQTMGFGAPTSWKWFLIGSVVALGTLLGCTVVAWTVFGEGQDNWFVQHAQTLQEALAPVPAGVSPVARFWIVTAPAMLFSPLAEEFLYRGFMYSTYSTCWEHRTGMGLQAGAFALVHLAHYGLHPFQPALLTVWLPSMFIVALCMGWIVQKSGSVWPAVVAHSLLNLGMNGIVFGLLPDLIG